MYHLTLSFVNENIEDSRTVTIKYRKVEMADREGKNDGESFCQSEHEPEQKF